MFVNGLRFLKHKFVENVLNLESFNFPSMLYIIIVNYYTSKI